jgi:hypothetical protein
MTDSKVRPANEIAQHILQRDAAASGYQQATEVAGSPVGQTDLLSAGIGIALGIAAVALAWRLTKPKTTAARARERKRNKPDD